MLPKEEIKLQSYTDVEGMLFLIKYELKEKKSQNIQGNRLPGGVNKYKI